MGVSSRAGSIIFLTQTLDKTPQSQGEVAREAQSPTHTHTASWDQPAGQSLAGGPDTQHRAPDTHPAFSHALITSSPRRHTLPLATPLALLTTPQCRPARCPHNHAPISTPDVNLASGSAPPVDPAPLACASSGCLGDAWLAWERSADWAAWAREPHPHPRPRKCRSLALRGGGSRRREGLGPLRREGGFHIGDLEAGGVR